LGKASAHDILKNYWGFTDFRPLQEDIIKSVLDGKDSLALMPTGGGKSLCFQVPALCKEGVCLVISPLIALMKDQVFNLKKRGIAAEAIYSGMYFKEIDRILDNCVYGKIKILYLSPERLTTELAIERIKKMKVNLLAVDEAHCISQWGYDFRPSYLKIAEIRALIPKTPVLALTATATSEVVKDIQDKLEFKKKLVFRQSFERKNLAYVVLHEEGKLEKLVDIVTKVRGSGLVYVRSRRKAKDVAQLLRKKNISADFYHAGLKSDVRSAKQDAWLNNQTRIIVATNAFGMGIDKPDVRIVVHLDLPDSLEAYFQEAGRVGRDGLKSYSVLLYNKGDEMNLKNRFELSFPDLKEVRLTYQALGSYLQLAIGGGNGESFDFDLAEFSRVYGFEVIKAYNCLKILEKASWLVLSEAVYISSKLQILVSKEELYDYQIRNEKFRPLIKTILRTYQGAFNHIVSINEFHLARFLKTSITDLDQLFVSMKKEGIIEYHPQKDKPQLTLLHERLESKNLVFDKKMYDFRKKRQEERIKKAIAYAENQICRSKMLLNYFDEGDAKDCGICDVCLERAKTLSNSDDFERYKNKIQKLLKKEKLTIEELLESFSPKYQNRILKVIEYLLDEQMLKKEDDKLVWK
jgi:ATP-dependent DNA helicase RecQ